ncbi:MAG: aldo/keto reductase, partial [Lachnospiraceae bacterium]|nr:aldo/keto reductase [Lachnospiraceae bacterium]
MRYITFGEEKQKVSEIVLGLMRIGPGKTTTKSMSVPEVEYLLDTAYDCGINMLDNADVYANV